MSETDEPTDGTPAAPTSETSIASDSTPEVTTGFRPLRIWPPILFVVGMVVSRMLPGIWGQSENAPANLWMAPAFGPALCGILILLWWVIASRARWQERLLGFLGAILASVTTFLFLDGTMKGPPMIVVTIPLGLAAFAIGAILFHRLLSFRRTLIAVVCAFLGFGYSLLLRNEGTWSDFSVGLDWRWVPSAEDELMADLKTRETQSLSALEVDVNADLANPEWPEFRGAGRTGVTSGVNLAIDWESTPPKKLWSTRVGPGWSSFVVAGQLIFTQEQREEMEAVVCYSAETGKEIWAHNVKTRFTEALGGPGPRATPTLAGGFLYALGANGALSKLDPKTGDSLWTSELQEAAAREVPMWGFSSSPLIVDSTVVVHAGGKGDKGIIAFDAEDGSVQWSAKAGDHSYSSGQLFDLDGEQYLGFLTNSGMHVVDPNTGEYKLDYEWKSGGYRTLQPARFDENKILVPSGMGVGTRCLKLTKSDDGIATEELWSTLKLKPDFNDLVIHQGHIYGFDDAIFTSINLETGDRNWKKGRYGKGQVILVSDQALLIIATEKGEIVLLEANPDEHNELGRFQAIEGKTWNHHVLVGDRLYVRNAKEAACWKLPTNK